jgi:hypothetical protein
VGNHPDIADSFKSPGGISDSERNRIIEYKVEKWP